MSAITVALSRPRGVLVPNSNSSNRFDAQHAVALPIHVRFRPWLHRLQIRWRAQVAQGAPCRPWADWKNTVIADKPSQEMDARTFVVEEASIAAMFSAPADWPLMSIAVHRLARACKAVDLDSFGARAVQLNSDIESLALRVTVGPADLNVLMSGRRVKYPVWSMLTGLDEVSGLGLKLLGLELLLACTEGRQVRKPVLQRALLMSKNPRHSDANYVARIQSDASRQFARRQAGLPVDILRANSQIRSAIAVEMSARDPETRQCAGGRRTLPAPLLTQVARWLWEQDDATSAVLIAAFVVGLNWECAKLVAIANPDQAMSHVASLNVACGVLQIDLSESIPVVRKRDGYEEVSAVVHRALPPKVAHRLQELHARNPAAKRIGELLNDQATSSRSVVGNFGKGATIAKLLASRGVAIVSAGVRREVGAYAIGAFGLVGKSQHHYCTFKQAELSEARAQIFEWLGWSSSERPTDARARVGSGATPTKDSVLSIDAQLVAGVEQSRVGRRCTLQGLLEFHNHYALACVGRAAFFTLARSATAYDFRARDWSPGNNFGTLVDKSAGPFGSASPLPISVALRSQLDLWNAHLQAMDSRLLKLGMSETTEARKQIRKVLAVEDCVLFFEILSNGCIRAPGSAALFHEHGMKGDAYRHFMLNELRQTGLASEVIEAIARHFVAHATVFSCASAAPPSLWLRQAANALDTVAARLNLRPIAGLRSKA